MTGRFVKGAWREYEPCTAVIVGGEITEDGHFIKGKSFIATVSEIDLSQLKREKK